MDEFTISQDDLARYLASKEQSDVVGYPRLSDGCLIAKTLHWKYPEITYANVAHNNRAAEVWSPVGMDIVRVPGDVEVLAGKFDAFPKKYTQPVTRQELEGYMPELFESKEG